jgi:hypothetical protein
MRRKVHGTLSQKFACIASPYGEGMISSPNGTPADQTNWFYQLGIERYLTYFECCRKASLDGLLAYGQVAENKGK